MYMYVCLTKNHFEAKTVATCTCVETTKSDLRIIPKFRPWDEPSHFPVVSVHGHEELGTNQKNLTVVEDDAAVVQDILVHHRPSRERRENTVFNLWVKF